MKKLAVIGLAIVALFFALFYGGMLYGFHAWVYLVILALSFGLSFAAMGIVRRIKNKSAANPKLSAEQIAALKMASVADEKAKAENIEIREIAEKKWQEEQILRNQEIDSRLASLAKEYQEQRQVLDEHLKKLDGMDYLCEDEKKLQVIELLIRLIETHRADTIKEALQEYDKLLMNKQLLEIEKKKLEAALQKAAFEHADRVQQMEAQKRHDFEMRCIAADSARSREKIASQLDSIGNMIYYDLHY